MANIPVAPKPIDVNQAQEVSKRLNKTETAQPGKFDSVLKENAGQSKTGIQTQPPTATQNITPVTQSNVREVEKTSPAKRVQKTQENSPVKKLFGSLINSQDQLNSLVNMSMSGQNFSSQQLITMQAGVYKSTMALDVAGKGVEQITSGLKTLFQVQV